MAIELHENTQSLRLKTHDFTLPLIMLNLLKSGSNSLMNCPDKVNYSPKSFAHYHSLESKGALPTQEQAMKCGRLTEALLAWVTAHKTMYDC